MPPLRLSLLALAAVITMSLVPVLVRSTVANEVTIGLVRLAIGVLVFTPIVLFGKGFKTLTRRDWYYLIAIGVVFAIHWLTYFTSIKLSGAAIGAMGISTYGVLYLVLAWMVNGEKISPIEWLGVFVCMGACIVAAPEISLSNQVFLGVMYGLFSALMYAALPLLHQRVSHLPTSLRTWGQFSFALLAFSLLLPKADWQLSADDWIYLTLLGVVSTAIAHSLWVKASTELPPLFTSLFYYLYVPSAMLQAAFFLGEDMTTRKLLAAGMILTASVGVILYRWRRSVKF